MPETKTPPKKPQESQEQEKKQASLVKKDNDAARAKLVESTKKPEKPKKEPEKKQPEKTEKPQKPEPTAPNKPEKKEKNWKVGLGTTEISNADHSMEVSTTGLKFENKKKSLEFTLGAATVTETGKPGSFPEQKTVPGFSLIKRF